MASYAVVNAGSRVRAGLIANGTRRPRLRRFGRRRHGNRIRQLYFFRRGPHVNYAQYADWSGIYSEAQCAGRRFLRTNSRSLTCWGEAPSQRAHIIQSWWDIRQETATGVCLDEEVWMICGWHLPIESNISSSDDSPRWICDCTRELGRFCRLSGRKDRTTEQCRE